MSKSKMMDFYLKDKNSKKETPINLQRRVAGKMFKYSTGIKVFPNKWDDESKKIKKGVKDYTRLNTILKNMQTKFDSTILGLQSQNMLNHENLRDELNQFTNKPVKKPVVIESFVEVWEKGWMASLAINKAPETVKKKGYALNSLLDFQKDSGYKLDFDTINDKFAERYKEWALNVKKSNGENRYTRDNAIHKNISISKEFMKWANRRGYTTCQAYKNISGYNEEYYAPFALDKQDIKLLMDLDFENVDWEELEVRECNVTKTKAALEKTRDAFVFRSLCGIRFSDYSQLTPNKVSGGKISLVTRKTSTSIQLPLHPYASKILMKYGYKVPKLCNQNENQNLKLLSRIAGFVEPVTITYKKGGYKIEEVKQRWELVSTHTARKTFITNCLRANINAHVVMELVGIKKESTFKRYVQVSGKDVGLAMEKLRKLYAS